MSQAQSEIILNLLKRHFQQTPEAELRKLCDQAQKQALIESVRQSVANSGKPRSQN